MAHYCVQILKPSKPWLNLLDLCKSKLCLTKPKPQTCSTTSRDQNPEIRSPEALPRASTHLSCLRKISHVPPQILDFQIVFVHTRRHNGLLVHRSTKPAISALIWAYTHFQDFWHILHASVDLAHAFHAQKLLLMSPNDVITPRQSWHVIRHASPSTRHRMTSAALLLNPWPDSDQYPLTLTMD